MTYSSHSATDINDVILQAFRELCEDVRVMVVEYIQCHSDEKATAAYAKWVQLNDPFSEKS